MYFVKGCTWFSWKLLCYMKPVALNTDKLDNKAYATNGSCDSMVNIEMDMLITSNMFTFNEILFIFVKSKVFQCAISFNY